MRLKRLDRRSNVRDGLFKRPQLAVAVAHSTIVEAQRRSALARQCAGQEQELTVAADTVLRTADDDQYANPARALGDSEDADKPFALAFKTQGALVVVHLCQVSTASSVDVIIAGHSAISCVCQNGRPSTTRTSTRWPADRHM